MHQCRHNATATLPPHNFQLTPRRMFGRLCMVESFQSAQVYSFTGESGGQWAWTERTMQRGLTPGGAGSVPNKIFSKIQRFPTRHQAHKTRLTERTMQRGLTQELTLVRPWVTCRVATSMATSLPARGSVVGHGSNSILPTTFTCSVPNTVGESAAAVSGLAREGLYWYTSCKHTTGGGDNMRVSQAGSSCTCAQGGPHANKRHVPHAPWMPAAEEL